MKYRAEIDGLRAAALIPVILFHAGFKSFRGGFIGVDIFFVISGYLITTVILSEKDRGTFSLIQFYERRARRILPALFLVMLASLPFAWLWLFPSDFKSFSKSMLSVSVFSSNILFWRETGYWDAASELKPLLHTWSLAVEEQYYMLFPLFLMLMWRFRKRKILRAFIVIAILSLLLAQWGAYHKPIATFYLLPMRGWELAIGATIAFFLLYKTQTVRSLLACRPVNESLCIAGLLMIGFSIYSFGAGTPFPSFYALIPTIGTGLIVFFSSSQTVVGRLFGTKPLVGIGLISYSAYLWHQPIFALARHRTLTKPSDACLLLLALLSFLLAYLSWYFVERPFRNRDAVSRKTVFSFALIGSFTFFTIGLAGTMSNGFRHRNNLSEITEARLEYNLNINAGLSAKCDDVSSLPPDCRTSDEPEILIWGDSCAMHLTQGILASNPRARIIQMTKSSCGPFFDVAPLPAKYPVSWARECLDFTGKVREFLGAHPSVKYAVLSSTFSQYLSKNEPLLFRNNDLVASNPDLTAKEFEKTLAELENMNIIPVVFSPPPANAADLGRCLVQASWLGKNLDECNFPLAEMSPERILVYGFLKNIEKNHHVVYLNRLLCNDSFCATHFGDILIFRDANHLSIDGSAELGRRFNFYQIIAGSQLQP